MKILLSPSKTMNLKNDIEPVSQPLFKKHAKVIMSELSKLSVAQLQVFYGISNKLAHNVYSMYHQKHAKKAAIGFYKGEAYRHLDVSLWSHTMAENAQKSLRILCAMYGYLRPYDAIVPYRMDFLVDFNHLGLESSKAYWSTHQIKALLDESKKGEFVFNLASKEFSNVIYHHDVVDYCHWIDVDFLVEKDGNLKTVSMVAKKARGLFTKELLKHPINSKKELYSIHSFDEFVLDIKNSHDHYLRYVLKKK